jgi:hypothetical protein
VVGGVAPDEGLHSKGITGPPTYLSPNEERRNFCILALWAKPGTILRYRKNQKKTVFNQ